MKLVSINELKPRLCEVLRRLREPVGITRHGHVVAVLSPGSGGLDSLLLSYEKFTSKRRRRARA